MTQHNRCKLGIYKLTTRNINIKKGLQMGEAKNRGSEHQRKQQALDRIGYAEKLINNGDAPHYAFILDRSGVGSNGLKTLREFGPGDLKDRVNGESVRLWEKLDFEYVIVEGSWGYTGGLTAQFKNFDSLINEGLPALEKRIKEKSGLFTILPLIADEQRGKIEPLLANIVPVQGNC